MEFKSTSYAHLHECEVIRDARRGVPGMHLVPRAGQMLSTLMPGQHMDGAQFALLLAFDLCTATILHVVAAMRSDAIVPRLFRFKELRDDMHLRSRKH